VFALLLLAALAGGCKKSAPAPSLLPPPVETVARFHWLGKQRLAADTNAASVMEIWNLPESKSLETQTLDRLTLGLLASNQLPVAGGQSPATNPPLASQLPTTNNPPSTLLRPLLEDLLQQECFVEVRQATNQPGELACAIRLSETRAHLWETNLAAVVESMTGSRAAPAPGRTNGWQLPITGQRSPITRYLELARAGEWTVVGLGRKTNALVGEMLALIQRDGSPFASQPKEFWLYADVDLRRVASALLLDWSLPAELPRMTVAIDGDAQNVHTRGQFDFPKPLPAELEPWNIPTNLVHDPVCSFTAIRGLGPWLSSLKTWNDLQLGAPPNQLYFWAQGGLPFLTYCAAPLPTASNVVDQIAGRLVRKANPWLATNSIGQFARATNVNGVTWNDLPIMKPYLQSATTTGGEFVFIGLNSDLLTNRPVPPVLFQQVLGPANLVAYDWEITGSRIEQWLFSGQFLRMVSLRAQVPPKSVSVVWLQALESKLGNCATAVTRTGPAQLSFTRRSSIGFTAVELHLLADWLESPQFPRGLHTFLAQPDPLPRKKSAHSARGARTNSVPAAPLAKP
jgi:hypothetical protein